VKGATWQRIFSSVPALPGRSRSRVPTGFRPVQSRGLQTAVLLGDHCQGAGDELWPGLTGQRCRADVPAGGKGGDKRLPRRPMRSQKARDRRLRVPSPSRMPSRATRGWRRRGAVGARTAPIRAPVRENRSDATIFASRTNIACNSGYGLPAGSDYPYERPIASSRYQSDPGYPAHAGPITTLVEKKAVHSRWSLVVLHIRM
jgi:hypothetical protein